MKLPKAQQATLRFLALDHGDARIMSLLSSHPLAQELELPRRTIIAQYDKEQRAFLIYPDGSISPLTNRFDRR